MQGKGISAMNTKASNSNLLNVIWTPRCKDLIFSQIHINNILPLILFLKYEIDKSNSLFENQARSDNLVLK